MDTAQTTCKFEVFAADIVIASDVVPRRVRRHFDNCLTCQAAALTFRHNSVLLCSESRQSTPLNTRAEVLGRLSQGAGAARQVRPLALAGLLTVVGAIAMSLGLIWLSSDTLLATKGADGPTSSFQFWPRVLPHGVVTPAVAEATARTHTDNFGQSWSRSNNFRVTIKYGAFSTDGFSDSHTWLITFEHWNISSVDTPHLTGRSTNKISRLIVVVDAFTGDIVQRAQF